MRRSDTTLDDGPAPARAQRTVATLRVLFSVDRALDAPAAELRDGETLIGREVEPPSGVVLDDPRASRLHARLEVRAADRTAVLANESRRGTEVDGAPVERAPLRDGAVITAGHTLLLFRWESRPIPPDAPVPGLLGSAPAMRAVRAGVRLAARGDAPVTLLGETGSGKEVVARAIHELSARAGAFVAVNCAAIPEALAESQLFGHVAGAFTGARAPVEGLFRGAADGTLFLDEVGELSAAVQAKLLRALETGAVAPVGAARELPHRARVVTATHRDLSADVAAGRFRADLYARISDLVITLPPLRERPEDVFALLGHAFDGALPPLEFALARALVLHPWPFNVRELVRLAGQLRLRAEDQAGAPLSLELAAESLERTRKIASAVPSAAGAAGTLPPTRGGGAAPSSAPAAREAPGSTPPAPNAPGAQNAPGGGAEKPPDRDALVALLQKHRGVVTDVAKAVGRSRKQVYRWIEAHALDPASFRAEGEGDDGEDE